MNHNDELLARCARAALRVEEILAKIAEREDNLLRLRDQLDLLAKLIAEDLRSHQPKVKLK